MTALAIAGPESLFISTSRHLPANADSVFRFAQLAFPGHRIPLDWGFFAGTMFWGRTTRFRAFTALRELGLPFEMAAQNVEQAAHALERTLGLAGVLDRARVGLVVPDETASQLEDPRAAGNIRAASSDIADAANEVDPGQLSRWWC